MKIAWFRPRAALDPPPFDPTAALIAGLTAEHDIQIVHEATAHDFVWQHFRAPFDTCVYELDDSAHSAFAWAYLLNYGGMALFHSVTLHDSRQRALARRGRERDYRREFVFNYGFEPQHASGHVWPMLRVPLVAAQRSVVPYRGVAAALRDEFPETDVRFAPLPVAPVAREAMKAAAVRIGVLASEDAVGEAEEALTHVRRHHADASLLVARSADALLHEADVVLLLRGAPGPVLARIGAAAMATGIPVVALETSITSDWPALDPHTWRPRGMPTDAAASVTIDVRDEWPSLATTVLRLAKDPELREKLSEGGKAWWRTHATTDAAVDAWNTLLREVPPLGQSPRGANWPEHLTADGTESARRILADCGVAVDLF